LLQNNVKLALLKVNMDGNGYLKSLFDPNLLSTLMDLFS
jgi:hypothetical protein